MNEIPVSSRSVRYFLEIVAFWARKLRDNAEYLTLAGNGTLHAMEGGKLPAWVLNHQAVADVYQAEGALQALRAASASVLLGDEDDHAAFNKMISHPDRFYQLTVRNPEDSKSKSGGMEVS